MEVVLLRDKQKRSTRGTRRENGYDQVNVARHMWWRRENSGRGKVKWANSPLHWKFKDKGGI